MCDIHGGQHVAQAMEHPGIQDIFNYGGKLGPFPRVPRLPHEIPIYFYFIFWVTCS